MASGDFPKASAVHSALRYATSQSPPVTDERLSVLVKNWSKAHLDDLADSQTEFRFGLRNEKLRLKLPEDFSKEFASPWSSRLTINLNYIYDIDIMILILVLNQVSYIHFFEASLIPLPFPQNSFNRSPFPQLKLSSRTILEVICRNILIGVEDDRIEVKVVLELFDSFEVLNMDLFKDRAMLEWCVHATRQLNGINAKSIFRMKKFLRFGFHFSSIVPSSPCARLNFPSQFLLGACCPCRGRLGLCRSAKERRQRCSGEDLTASGNRPDAVGTQR